MPVLSVVFGLDFSQFGLGVHAGRGRVTVMALWLFVTIVITHSPQEP